MRSFLALLVLVLAAGCGGTRPPASTPDATGNRLRPCPASPNCVSSGDTDEQHGIAPLAVEGDAQAAWARAREAVLALPRTVLVVDEPGYLHAESTTALMRYVDDVELQLAADGSSIGVRAAARGGYGDMGANRARIAAIRAAYVATR